MLPEPIKNALITLLIGAIPSFLIWLKARAEKAKSDVKYEAQQREISQKIIDQDVKTREWVLSRAKESEEKNDRLEKQLEAAIGLLNMAQSNERAALEKLASAIMELRIANIQIDTLTKKIHELEEKQKISEATTATVNRLHPTGSLPGEGTENSVPPTVTGPYLG